MKEESERKVYLYTGEIIRLFIVVDNEVIISYPGLILIVSIPLCVC
jgi:hypothetical protein